MTGLPESWHAPLTHPAWSACRAGWAPAEVLPTLVRARLVAVLLREGWSVSEVAAHCRMSEYTTRRIAA